MGAGAWTGGPGGAGFQAFQTKICGLCTRLAEALIFPSLEEGFGWPVLEAQACGCAVFATGRAPMTELGGDAAVYFDPGDVEGAARAIAEGLQGREAMVAAGLENVRRFNVGAMIDGYVDAYQKVIAADKKA